MAARLLKGRLVLEIKPAAFVVAGILLFMGLHLRYRHLGTPGLTRRNQLLVVLQPDRHAVRRVSIGVGPCLFAGK